MDHRVWVGSGWIGTGESTRYRPKLLDGDDVTPGEVPVECWRYPEAAAGSAAVMATVAAIRNAGAVQIGPGLRPRGGG
jgi:hypothetical protein